MFNYATSFDHSLYFKQLPDETPIKPEALTKLERFARQGQVQGQQILAEYYYLGKVYCSYLSQGVEKDYVKALEFSELAAKQENIEGVYYLGRYWFEGLAGTTSSNT
jgi:TPR repeat protein